MKIFFILFFAQLKRISKNMTNMSYFVFFPIAILILIFVMRFFTSENPSKNKNKDTEQTGTYKVKMDEIGYFVNDEGNLWEMFFASSNLSKIKPENPEDELKKTKEELSKGKIIGLIIIPKDFSAKLLKGEKPELEILKTAESNIFDNRLQALNLNINSYLLNQFIEKSSFSEKKENILNNNINIVYKNSKGDKYMINLGIKIITLLILYIILFSSTGIAIDLIKFRESKMLARAIISPNSEFKIIGAFLSSFVFIQVMANMLILIAAAILFKIKIAGFSLIFLSILSTSCFALSLSILIARIFKKQSQINTVSTIISLITIILFFLAFITILAFVPIPEIFRKLAFISPFTWLMEMIDKEKLFPNLLVVWAMIIAIFTSGSWKIKEFNNGI